MSVKEGTKLQEVEVQALDAARLEPLIGPDRTARFEAIAEATESLLGGRTVLNVNSTATGGGVAEMLQTLLAYGRGAGLDIRWLVIRGDPAFFEITTSWAVGLRAISSSLAARTLTHAPARRKRHALCRSG